MGSVEAPPAPGLISASRRTDIPRYYSRWFAARWREGFAEYRTAFGVPGRVSLRPEAVLGALFWTRDVRPFLLQLRILQDQAVPAAFQFTINGYARDLEPHRPALRGALDSFRAVSEALPGPESIQWRYDPIVLSDRTSAAYHVAKFGQLARELSGATRVVNVSVVEPYIKAIRRIAEPSTRYRAVDPARHKSVARKHPTLPRATDAPALLAELAAIAAEHAIELRVCSNPEYSLTGGGRHPASQCIGPELFAPYGAALLARLAALPDAPSRSGCRCLRAADIGMDNTCLAGCRYCYVTTSLQAAVDNFRRHDPSSPRLR
jgi:hypothetical protein